MANPIPPSNAILPLRRPVAFQHGDGVNVATITGTLTLTIASAQVQKINGGVSDRDVVLPPPLIPDNIGHPYRLYNAGSTNNLVLKTSAGTTLATLLPSQWADVEHGPSNYVVTAVGGAGAGGSDFGAPGLLTDAIGESTAAAGVTVDGVLLKDNVVTVGAGGSVVTDTIAEKTGAAGVTVDGLRIKDRAITPTAGGSAYADLTNCATGEADIVTAPNLASAHESRDSVGSHWRTCTTTGARRQEIVIPLEIQGGYRLATYAIPRVEEFYGDVGGALPRDYVKDVQGDATGDYISAQGAGVYRLATAVTSEAEAAQITGGDALHVLLSKEPIIEFRVRVSPAGAAFTADERLVIGLVSAHASAEDALDSTTYNLWFRVEGASLAVVVEKDDNAANVDDQASGLTVVKDSWHTFRIDCSSLAAPVLSMDGTAQSGAALDMSAASAQFLQPIVCMQRDAGTEINTLDVDYIAIYQKR